MPGSRLRLIVLVAVVALALTAGAIVLARRLMWNGTPSVPKGLYLLRPSAAATVGSTVVLPIPRSMRRLIAERRYLPESYDLMKRVVALPGDVVCLDGGDYRVNGRRIARIRAVDSRLRPLPLYNFCDRVPRGQAFVATGAPLSFDSRYFGPVPLSTLTVVTPLWTYSP
jgi:conjugative transfer signal peptidase TraF